MYYEILERVKTAEDLDKYLLDIGKDINSLAVRVLEIYTYSQEDQKSKEQIIQLLIEKGAKFDEVYSLYRDFSYETYELLLSNGLKPHIVLGKALGMSEGEAHDKLLDLVLSYKPDLSDFSVSLSTSKADLDKCLANGLSIDKASSSVLGAYTSNEEQKEKQENLIKFLIEKGVRFDEVSYLYHDLSLETYELLLSNGLKPHIVLGKALDMSEGEAHDKLLDLALSYKPDFSKFSVSLSTSKADLDTCLANGLSIKRAASTVLDGYTSNEEQKEKQENLIKFLIEKGARFDDVSYLYYDLSFETYELLLSNGLKPHIVLGKALNMSEGEAHDKLLDLALSQKLDLNIISLSSVISQEDLEKCLANGLSLNKAAISVINAYTSNEEQKEKQANLIKFLIEKGARFDEVSYLSYDLSLETYELLLSNGLKPQIVLSTYSSNDKEKQENLVKYLVEKGARFDDVYSLYCDFSLETYELLLSKGLKPNVVLTKALGMSEGEAHDKLLDLALSYKPDFNNFSLSSVISQEDLDKCLAKGLSINRAAQIVLSTYSSNDKEKQENLVKYLVEKGARFDDVYSLYCGFSLETYELLLSKGLKTNVVLTKALGMPEGEAHDKLLDLALSHKPDFSNFSVSLSTSKVDLDKCLANGLSINKAASSVFAVYTSSDEQKEKQENLIEYFLEKGVRFDGVNYLNANLSLETLKVLIDNGLPINPLIYVAQTYRKDKISDAYEIFEYAVSRGAKIKVTSDSSAKELLENNMHEFILFPERIFTQKYKNLNATKSDEPKMPYKLHHIWLTHPDKPREIREQDIENAIKTRELFSMSEVKWEQIVWTNRKDLIPNSVKKLKEQGIQVISIDEYPELSLLDLVESKISQQKWGLASDILRYVIVENFGGVYADINYIFARDVTDEAHKYNFFSQTFGDYYIDNFFFGASAHHPVIQKMVELVDRNMNNPPSYLKEIDQDSTTYTDMGTANPTFISYYLEANKKGNIDVIYPKIDYKLYQTPMSSNGFRYDFDDRFFDYRINNERDSDFEHLFSHLSEMYKRANPDEQAKLDQEAQQARIISHFRNYVYENEICGDASFFVGHDSTDGRTWV